MNKIRTEQCLARCKSRGRGRGPQFPLPLRPYFWMLTKMAAAVGGAWRFPLSVPGWSTPRRSRLAWPQPWRTHRLFQYVCIGGTGGAPRSRPGGRPRPPVPTRGQNAAKSRRAARFPQAGAGDAGPMSGRHPRRIQPSLTPGRECPTPVTAPCPLGPSLWVWEGG